MSRGLQVPEYPAQSVYQRPGQAIFSKGRPNSRFIKAMSKAVVSRPWPFYQGRSSQVARHPDLSRGLQVPYEPSQSVYQHPGQATKSEPNGRFIKASVAVLSRPWPFYQSRSSGLQIQYHPAQSVYQRPGQAIFSKSRSNGRFTAEAAKWPDMQI